MIVALLYIPFGHVYRGGVSIHCASTLLKLIETIDISKEIIPERIRKVENNSYTLSW